MGAFSSRLGASNLRCVDFDLLFLDYVSFGIGCGEYCATLCNERMPAEIGFQKLTILGEEY